MTIRVMNIGDLAFLDFLTGNGGADLDGCICHLYTNNVTPAASDVLGTYTEAAWTGYASQAMSLWPAAAIVSNKGSSNHPAIFFTNGSAGSVNTYGYYVTDSGGTLLLFAERFAAAPVAIPAGLSLFLQITFTDNTEF